MSNSETCTCGRKGQEKGRHCLHRDHPAEESRCNRKGRSASASIVSPGDLISRPQELPQNVGYRICNSCYVKLRGAQSGRKSDANETAPSAPEKRTDEEALAIEWLTEKLSTPQKSRTAAHSPMRSENTTIIVIDNIRKSYSDLVRRQKLRRANSLIEIVALFGMNFTEATTILKTSQTLEDK